jgi:hypothetical protein
MDCPAFFEVATDELGARAAEVTRATVGGQCVFEFYHPAVVATLGTDGLATSFNRSGVVWVPAARRLGVQVRVPDDRDQAVSSVLRDAPLAFDRTDHRGVSGPDGDVVTIVHFAARVEAVDDDALRGTLATLGAALAV